MMVLLYPTGAPTGGCCTDANVQYFMNVMICALNFLTLLFPDQAGALPCMDSGALPSSLQIL